MAYLSISVMAGLQPKTLTLIPTAHSQHFPGANSLLTTPVPHFLNLFSPLPPTQSLPPLNSHWTFFFLAVLEFELKASCLLGGHSTTRTTPPVLFALVISEIGSRFSPRQAWTVIFLFYASCCSWDDSCMLPHPGFFWGRGVEGDSFLWTFCLG
jgi:hypothetical protein